MIEAQPPHPRWEIILTRQAEKALRHLPKIWLRLMDRAIMGLGQNPRPPEAQNLVGPYDNLYRLRVDEWRILYAVEAEQRTVLILEIAPKQQPERYLLDEPVDTDLTFEEQPTEEKFVRPDIGALEKILAKLTDAERRTLFLNTVKDKFLF